MSRDFGLIKSSLWGSSRFRRLGCDTARLAYLYLHANDHGNANGAYRLPVEYLSADMRCDAEKARQILADLSAVGLIRYDFTEAVVMICKWFDHNPINSPKHLMGSVRAFQRLPSMTSFLPQLAADIVASAWAQSRSLHESAMELKRSANVKSRDYGEKKLESVAQMVEQMLVLRDAVSAVPGRLPAFVAALDTLPERIKASISEGLSIPLSIPLSIHKRQETRHTNSNSNSDTDQKPQQGLAELVEDFVQRGRAAT